MGRNSTPKIVAPLVGHAHSSRTAITLLILAAILTLLAMYFSPLFSGKSLVAPDFSLSSVVFEQKNFPSFIGGGWDPLEMGRPSLLLAPTAPRLLLLEWMSPDTYRYAAFMLNTILLFLAAAYLLRGKGLLWTSTLIGALAMAFSGQSFTIISAGHLGKFCMMPCAVLMLALIDRAVHRRSWPHYALAGCVAAMGMFDQPDVMVLFYMLCGAYLLHTLWRYRREDRGSASLAKQVGGMLLAGAVFAAVVLPTVVSTINTRVADRRDLIAESGLTPYEYATCWSMPPEEVIEFFAPSFFGAQTGDANLPYWGRLGQSRIGDNDTQKRLNSLRQHNLYLGVLQIVFALYAVGIGIAGSARGRGQTSELRFWSLAWLVTFVLALGRYTPLYHLFYTVPYISSMRCPIKFMHLIEICTVVLFSIGLDRFLRDIQVAPSLSKKNVKPKWRPSPASILFLIIAVAAATGAAIVCASGPDFSYVWSMLPSPLQRGKSLLDDYGPALMGNMISGLIRVSILATLGVAIVEIGRTLRGRASLHTWIASIIGLILAIDIVTASSRYVQVRDLSSLAEKNEVLRAVEPTQQPFRVSIFQSELAKPGPTDQICEMLRDTATMYDMDFVRAPFYNYFPAYLELARTLGADGIGIRYWQMTSSDYVFGPVQLVARLAGKPDFTIVAGFNIVADGKGLFTWRRSSDGKGRYLLLKNGGALPRALVYHDWRSVGTNDWKTAVVDPSFDPHNTVIVESPATGTPPGLRPTPVSSLVYSR
ncbi:MAG: hypothetical protein WCP86_07350, partial [bacterium]